MKTIALYVSAVLLLVFAVIISSNYSTPDVFYGPDAEFHLYDHSTLVIENVAEVNFEAASSKFYALHQGSNAVVGTLEKAPVGWNSKVYFKTSETIRSGTWVIDTGGSINVRIYDENANDMKITVGKTPSEIVSTTVMTMMAGVGIWMLLYVLFTYAFKWQD